MYTGVSPWSCVVGFQTTRRQVISVVHIGASTLGKRVDEFGATRAGDLTVADFNRRCREQERLLRDYMSEAAERDSLPEDEELLCIHIREALHPIFVCMFYAICSFADVL